jgi:Ribbon-helix-helix protein, copG family
VAVNGVRKMLFANLYTQDEVDLVERLCKDEGVSISNLLRRAVANMADESGIEIPTGSFEERVRGRKKVSA